MSFKNYANEAAWSRIVKQLERFKRGDIIEFKWVKETGMIADAMPIEGRLHTHFFAKQNMEIERRTDLGGWYLLTNEEQKEKIASRQKKRTREGARTIRTIAGVDLDKLSPTDRKRVEAQQRHIVHQLQEDTSHQRECRAIMGIPEPRPELKK